MSILATEATMAAAATVEVEFAKCECCGLGEDCTPAYINLVREQHNGLWICGLCSEAVQDEIRRAGCRISTEEAIDRHMRFSRKFRSAAERPEESAELLIVAMRQLLRRGLESPQSPGSTKASLRRRAEGKVLDRMERLSFTRSEGCLPAVAGLEKNRIRAI